MDFYQVLFARKFGLCSGFYEAQFGRKLGGYSWLSDYEQTPYIYRAMPNMSHYYNREIMDAVVGGSVGWNQLCNPSTFRTHNGITPSFSDGIITLSGTATNNYTNCFGNVSVISGHKLIVLYTITANPNNLPLKVTFNNAVSAKIRTDGAEVDLVSLTTNAGVGFDNITSGADYTGVKLKASATDLTLALGSTIADYVYSLEQATAGSGVAWLKANFPKMFGQYNPYDAGSIQSVSGLVSHDMVGKNLFDANQDFPYIETYAQNGTPQYRRGAELHLPQGTYTFTASKIGSQDAYIYLNIVNSDGSFDEFAYFVTGGSAVTVTKTLGFGQYFILYDAQATTESTPTKFDSWQIQAELGSTATTYEPYRKSSYPLDSTLTLRGIPKLDNGKLYYDGDTYGADGSVSRKYGIRPYQNGDESLADAVTDGTNTVYKLATPTTETAQPFTKTQKCDSGGTEEFVATGVNVWDEVSESGYISIADGTDQSGSAYARSKNYSKCLPNTSYYFRCSASQETSAILWYDADKNYISGVGAKNETVTSPSNAYYFRIYYDVSTYNHDISINYPSTDTAYHPYGCLVSVGHKSKYAEK